MGTDIPEGTANGGDGELPAKIQRIIDGVKDGSISGISAKDFIQVFQAISGSHDAIKLIAEVAGQSQKDAQANIKQAIDGDSETLADIARKLETDEARLEFTRLYLEREREKTKQAKTASKANDSNNRLFASLAAVVVAGVLGGIKLLSDRRA